MAGQPTLIYSAEFSFFLLLPDGKNISGAGVRPGLLLFLPPAPPTHTIGMVVVGRDGREGRTLWFGDTPANSQQKASFFSFVPPPSWMAPSFIDQTGLDGRKDGWI